MTPRASFAAAALVACAACDRSPANRATPPRPSESDAATTAIGAGPCGPLECRQFPSPGAAMGFVLGGDVRVLAIGEAHAPKGATAPSASSRFAGDLLPLLAGRASDLLVELLMPPKGCAAATAEVRAKQAPVTKQEAPTNQNEYVAMGEKARALGIVPDMLRPSCADMDAVRDAGDGAIDASLAMIARLSMAQADRLLARDARSDADRDKLVILYGGMLHNDLSPTPGQEAWSYAPALDARTGGKLVALDLVVPEFIADDETWRALPWVAQYDRARLGERTTLFRTGERSYVLVFPESGPR